MLTPLISEQLAALVAANRFKLTPPRVPAGPADSGGASYRKLLLRPLNRGFWGWNPRFNR